ncbi:putative sporulation protein YtxC [Salibacterium halotolerans]|uniref:putative sporulation protein YtxC n=1 Tax=Salibacterium halotolerans TaxID=1884432 RepID=UPI0011132F98|nr:putative sporulation protein YtxC [Salibacterium halotolerans]
MKQEIVKLGARGNRGLFSIDFDYEADSLGVYHMFRDDQLRWRNKGIPAGAVQKHKSALHWEFHGSEREWRESLVPYLAASLSDYIVREKEWKWVKEFIEESFLYKEEAPAIAEIAHSLLNGEREEVPETTLLQKRKHFIYREMAEEIKHHRSIQWRPMFTFRFGAYYQLLVKAASAAIDEYKWEQEYQTLVESCRHYRKQIQPRHDAVHILLQEEPVFLNEDKQVIDEWTRLDYLEPKIVFEDQLPFEYMVISPAVSLAPKYLYLYTDNEDGTVQTFRKIFEEHLIVLPPDEWPSG